MKDETVDDRQKEKNSWCVNWGRCHHENYCCWGHRDYRESSHERIRCATCIVKVGGTSGAVQVDMTSLDSIRRMYQTIGKVDAVISTAGNAQFGPLEQLTQKEFEVGISSKFLGQVNLVLLGRDFVNDDGSFTLTSGILSQDPIPGGAAVTPINAAVEGFVLGASIEMPRGLRINAVSPGVLEESMEKIGAFFR